jgi:Cu-processing system permease protein
MGINAVYVIAVATVKGFARDRVFHATLIFSILFTLFSYLLAQLTIIESRKILVDFGLSAISICGVLLALLVGITAIGREVETKTIYTVLSKPISRTHYLLGKYLGCALSCLIAHILISCSLLLILHQLGEGYPDGLLACFYLMTLETLFVLAIALYFSTSVSSSFLAGSITVAIFLIGRSANTFKIISNRSNSLTPKYVTRFFYDVFPNLERFDVRELVAYSKPIDQQILIWSSLYFAAYCIAFLTMTALRLRRKDLA